MASSHTGKLTRAIDLVKNSEDVEKGIRILNQLCMSKTLTPEDKLDVITEYLIYFPDESQDILDRWRDTIPFVKDDDLEDLLSLLSKIAKCERINSHQRMVTAVNLYNNCFLNICYDCFSEIASDENVLVKYRVDSARYLFCSGEENNKENAQNILLSIIEDIDIYTDQYRYEVIASFISRSGINSIMNMKKLRVPYDEDFVYSMQSMFFFNKKNDVRYRILSGQNILQMDSDENEKENIFNDLLDIAKEKSFSENTRADAADVVLRLGDGEKREVSREIITDLGYDSANSFGMTGSLMDRVKTVYNNSQNIHQFSDQIDSFIEKMVKENVKVRPYHEVHQEVVELVRSTIETSEDRFKASKSLNRISIDTASFTRHKVTLAEIFVHIWARIKISDESIQKDLEKRFVEELIDMSETCSSGHIGRFVNVLAVYDDDLKIGWSEQIVANMAGRINARIRDCQDPDIRAALAVARTELAEDEDNVIYDTFITENLTDLHNELYQEFVSAGYLSHEEFEIHFENGKADYI